MARAVETCVHCGFCLTACPTYQVLGEEMDSPRGRIVLMKQVLEGTLSADDAQPHVDRCLGCLGCVTACPSRVAYGDLLVPFRSSPVTRGTSTLDRLQRQLLLDTLESPALFRVSARLGAIAKRAARVLPARVRPMLDLLPTRLPEPVAIPPLVKPIGPRRARVGLLAGCVQQALGPEIALTTVRVLAANGVEVVTPPQQGCCGALALHTGEADRAYDRATALIRAFPPDLDAVVTNAAGCGSAMKEYGHAFAGRAQEDALAAFSSRVRDVSEFLHALGQVPMPPLDEPLVVAYHDACHLSHAQGIRRAPRALLASIPNVRIVDIPDGDICCGSAGLYNVEHPDIADTLGARKARAVATTGADVLTAGNIGCLVQIARHLNAAGTPIPVMHTMVLLDRAIRNAPATGNGQPATG
ncbi:MAG: (Fe-S)-binding protein [Acidobacteria bacterium]|nr:(Fe-S)-binding protein [Acidobacteriota bacterium]